MEDLRFRAEKEMYLAVEKKMMERKLKMQKKSKGKGEASKSKNETEASDLDSEKKKSKSKINMEGSNLELEKKMKEASDLDSEKKGKSKFMKEASNLELEKKTKTEAYNLDSQKKKKAKKKGKNKKKKNLSLDIEEYEPSLASLDIEECEPVTVETKTSLEKCSEEEKEAISNMKKSIQTQDGSFMEFTESDSTILKEYRKQIVISGGFDIDCCPPYFECNIAIVDLEDDEGDEEYHQLCHLSELAIDKFNKDNSTNFKFFKYVKANWAPCAGEKYYITFEAKQDPVEAPTTFQALVWDGIPTRDGTKRVENVQVILVRMKSAASVKDNPILLDYTDE